MFCGIASSNFFQEIQGILYPEPVVEYTKLFFCGEQLQQRAVDIFEQNSNLGSGLYRDFSETVSIRKILETLININKTYSITQHNIYELRINVNGSLVEKIEKLE